MAVLPLVIAPDVRLTICSEEVNEVNDDVRSFIDDMVETMHKQGGIGLAAVQVGVHKRILVMDIDGTIYHLINPEIIEESDEKNIYNEGCLSFPEQSIMVTRPKNVKVKYLDYNSKEQILECDQLLATCVQHEIDHLNGVVLFDHGSKLKKEMAMNKAKKIKRKYS